MGKPLMIQEMDDQRIEHLKKIFGMRKKIDIVRAGLELLEQEAARLKKIKRWKKAAALVSKQSAKINKEFQKYSVLKKL